MRYEVNRIRLNVVSPGLNLNRIGFKESSSSGGVTPSYDTRFEGDSVIVGEPASSFVVNVAVLGGTARFEGNKLVFTQSIS